MFNENTQNGRGASFRLDLDLDLEFLKRASALNNQSIHYFIGRPRSRGGRKRPWKHVNYVHAISDGSKYLPTQPMLNNSRCEQAIVGRSNAE